MLLLGCLSPNMWRKRNNRKVGNLLDNIKDFSFKVKISFKEGLGLTLPCESYSIDREKHELLLYDAGGSIIGWFSEVAWVYAERQSEEGEMMA